MTPPTVSPNLVGYSLVVEPLHSVTSNLRQVVGALQVILAAAARDQDEVVGSLDLACAALAFRPHLDSTAPFIRIESSDGHPLWSVRRNGAAILSATPPEQGMPYLMGACFQILSELHVRAGRRLAGLSAAAAISARLAQDPASFAKAIDRLEPCPLFPVAAWGARLRVLAAVNAAQIIVRRGRSHFPVARELCQDVLDAAGVLTEHDHGRIPITNPLPRMGGGWPLVLPAPIAALDALDRSSERFARRWGMAMALAAISRGVS